MESSDKGGYVLTITNQASTNRNIAVFQDFPDLAKTKGGVPVVWYSKMYGPGETSKFRWDIAWGLNWVTTEDKIVAGVSFESNGVCTAVEPSSDGDNGIQIAFNKVFTITRNNNPNLDNGQLQVTSKVYSPSLDETKNMHVAVCVNCKPVFVMPGEPNGTYKITTTPTYYIAVID